MQIAVRLQAKINTYVFLFEIADEDLRDIRTSAKISMRCNSHAPG
jgi:hypothetical protein